MLAKEITPVPWLSEWCSTSEERDYCLIKGGLGGAMPNVECDLLSILQIQCEISVYFGFEKTSVGKKRTKMRVEK